MALILEEALLIIDRGYSLTFNFLGRKVAAANYSNKIKIIQALFFFEIDAICSFFSKLFISVF